MTSGDADNDDRLAGSYPLLTMLAVAVCAWLLNRQENEADRQLRSGEGDPNFLGMKLAASAYYQEVIVPEAIGLRAGADIGATLFYSIPEECFAA